MKLDQAAARLTAPVEERDHAQGPVDAPVTLVEYGDYECPYCGRAYPILKRLRDAVGDRLRFVFRNFPMNSIHPHAGHAAQAAEAAAAQGKFWPMHDLLYEHQDDLDQTDLSKHALNAGLEIYKFEADLASERFAKRVRDDYLNGVRSGVNGTPTLFINDVRYDGKLDYDEILAAVEMAAAATDKARMTKPD